MPQTVRALNVPVEAAHPRHRAQSRALAMAARSDARALFHRQRARLPPRSDRGRQVGDGHARRRWRPRQQDAHLRRPDDARRLQPVLERAAGHREGRDDSASRERSWIPRAQQHGSRQRLGRGRSIRTSVDWSNPGGSSHSPAPGQRQRARRREVHLSRTTSTSICTTRMRPRCSTASNVA